MWKKTVLSLLLALLLGGCATLYRVDYENKLAEVVALINGGKDRELSALCMAPFLLDGEIILLAKDVQAFWAGILGRGFRIEDPSLVTVRFVDGNSFRRFADAREVDFYFKNYVSAGPHTLARFEPSFPTTSGAPPA